MFFSIWTMGYLGQIVNSEMAGVKKPHPQIFQMAIDMARTIPQRSIMIGDDLEADILGAKALGFAVIHYNQGKQPRHERCDIIDNLREISFYL